MPNPTITISHQELADRYRDAVERADLTSLATLYHPDVLLDAHVPNWRFQVRGRTEVARFTGTALPAPGHFASFSAEPTADGDLLVQFEWHELTADGTGARARQLHVLRLNDGHVTQQTVFCAGVWSRDLQERMAAEAPLVQP
jgi:ketosteroid isomerase-like protein